MEWTEEIVLQFIESYRSKQVLWDPKDPEYYNKCLKNDAWEELADEFKTTSEECRKKVNNLLSSLRREKAKMKKTQTTGSGCCDVHRSSWFAFKSLLFLWDKNNVTETKSTIEVEKKKPSVDTIINEEIGDMEPDVNHLNQVPSRPPTKRYKRGTDDAKLDKAFEILTKASAQREEDESQAFGNLVARKIAKYSCELQSLVQRYIMNIVFEADKTHISGNSIPNPSYNSPISYSWSRPSPSPSSQFQPSTSTSEFQNPSSNSSTFVNLDMPDLN